MPNPLRTDPSRTTMLRKRYMADMQRRFKAVSRAIQKLVVDEDVFGLIKSAPLTFMQRQAFRFKSDANKVKAYRKWLQQQIDAKILTVDTFGKPWTATYAESAYRKGMTRAYTQIHSTELAKSVDFYEGSKAQFIKDAFSQPASLSKIELMYTRAFDELKGVSAVMGQQMSRTLAAGLIKGDGPRAIARELRKNVSNITKTRAMAIARTEVIMVHAEGQLDAFEMLGVEEVGIMAEWSTAGDNRVCEQCGAMEGQVMSIAEARGQIPLHPNCRCAWIPFVKGIHRRRRKAVSKGLSIPGAISTVKKKSIQKFFDVDRKVAEKAVEKQIIKKKPVKVKAVVEKGTTKRPTIEYGEGTSDKFRKLVGEGVDAIPTEVLESLAKENIKIRVAENSLKALPRLKGVQPRGWRPGASWDEVGGFFSPQDRTVVISQKTFANGKWYNVGKGESKDLLKHEMGHAYDFSKGRGDIGLDYSDFTDFKTVYANDIARLKTKGIYNDVNGYFVQSGDAGRSETFAEVFAQHNGAYSGGTINMKRYFPSSYKHVGDLL